MLIRKCGDKMKLRRILLVITLALFVNISVKAAVGTWIGDYCESCGNYGSAGECDKVHQTTVGIFRVSFYLNGKKLGSSVNVSSNTTYQQNAMNAKWHWGDGKTDIVSYASGTGLGNPTAGGLSSIVISGISTSNVQTVLSPKKNSANVQAVLNQAGITEFKFKDGKIYYVPPKGECEGDYEIQMIVESMQIINWLCNSTGTSSHTWIGTPYELNNGLLAQGYNSHTGGNGYMSGSIVDKHLLSSLRIDKNVKVGNVSFSAVTDCLTTHIRGYAATQGYGFNVYNLTGDFEIECEDECCIPCSVSNVEGCDPDDCCYDEDLPVSTDGTTEACKPWDDYWNGRGDWEEVCNPKCDPNTDPNGCCDDPEYLREHPGYYEAYCMPKNKTCPIPSLNPEYIAPYCDEINGIDLDFVPLNTAYFRDPVFNSNGGQFSDYNKVELIEKFKGHLKLPLEWLERVVKEYDENTFLAVAYREDSRYTTKINDYCSMHCQELFEVTLPENYPYVNAGRYFKWTLYGSKSTIANAADVKLCAIDIDLDKAIDDYQDYSANTVGPATALANVTCHEKYGVQPVIDGEFDSCEGYADEIVSAPGCASDYVCLAYAEQGECCDSCPDYDAGGHQIGSHPCNCKPLYVCTSELHDAAARNWYARIGGTHYNPGCGSPGATFSEAMIKECNKKVFEYKVHVEGYSSYVEGIYNSIAKCNSLTDDDIEIDMGVQLNYYTFFNDYHYSTLNDEIDAIDSGGSFADNYLCANNGDTDECNKDEHKFALGDRSHDGQNPNAISCDNTTRWTEVEKYVDYKKVCGPGSVSAVNPNDELKLDYDSNGVKMLNINGFSRCGGFRDGVAGPEFDYTLAESWNTIYMAYVSASKLYELNEEINACTCKDGEIMDSVDGTCTCEREVSYSDFINSGYNNYQQLPDGTLKVEFMNPTGLYPINLIYWTIGSVDENGRGHFDSMLSDPNVDGTGHDLCDQNECPDGEDCCRYDDPRGICRIKIKNRIIATPDNTGDCEEPPCYPEPDDNGRCDNKPCPDPDPDDVGDCVDDNGNPTGKCEKSTDLNLIYRVIDLDNPFPGTDGRGRTPGVNWMGKEDVITNNRNMEGSAIYNKDVEPLYSMTLTPALIKEIRAGNHKTDSLLGYTSSMMYPEGPTEPGGGYSLFLHRYLETNDSIKIKYDDREQFSNIQKTGDGVK